MTKPVTIAVGVAATGLVSVLTVQFGPVVMLILVGVTLAIGVLTAKPQTSVMIAAAGTLASVIAVPYTRLGSDLNSLKLVVPLFILGLTALMCLRVGVRFNMALGVFVVYAILLAIATAIYPDQRQWSVYASTVAVAISALLIGTQVGAHRLWPRVRWLIIAIGLAEAGYSILEALLGLRPLWQGAKMFADGTSAAARSEVLPMLLRAQGTMAHPLLLAFVLIVALALLLRDAEKRSTRFWLALLLCAGVAATGSRNALLIAGLLVVFQAGRPSRAGRTPIVIMAGALIAVAVLPLVVPTVGAFLDTGSFTHRVGAVESITRLFTLRDPVSVLFGDGSASTPRLYAAGLLQSDGLAALDNQLILAIAESGIVGAILLIAICVSALRRARSGLRVALLMCMAQFAVFDVFAWPASALLFWLLIGISQSPDDPEAESHSYPFSTVAIDRHLAAVDRNTR